MNQENQDFCAGVIVGIIISCAILALVGVIKWQVENSGYTDKMIISYHCPDKEYERQRFREVVYGTGIQTNFVNLETSMDKNWIRIRMTNPKKN